MIKNINHMSFTVSDVDVSLKFYHGMLGLEIINVSERGKEFSEKATGIKNAHLKIAYLKGENCTIELVQYLSPEGEKIDTRTCNVGSAHICFNVKNFHEYVICQRRRTISITSDRDTTVKSCLPYLLHLFREQGILFYYPTQHRKIRYG